MKKTMSKVVQEETNSIVTLTRLNHSMKFSKECKENKWTKTTKKQRKRDSN